MGRLGTSSLGVVFAVCALFALTPTTAEAYLAAALIQSVEDDEYAGPQDPCVHTRHVVLIVDATGDDFGDWVEFRGRGSKNNTWSAPHILGECKESTRFKAEPDASQECETTNLCTCPFIEDTWFAHSRLQKQEGQHPAYNPTPPYKTSSKSVGCPGC